jgi:hypothetical protein
VRGYENGEEAKEAPLEWIKSNSQQISSEFKKPRRKDIETSDDDLGFDTLLTEEQFKVTKNDIRIDESLSWFLTLPTDRVQ